MKVFRKIKVLMGIIWLIFCFIGIISNFTHYDFVDWIIIIVVTVFPFIINHIIKTLHHKMSHNIITQSFDNAVVQDSYLHGNTTHSEMPSVSFNHTVPLTDNPPASPSIQLCSNLDMTINAYGIPNCIYELLWFADGPNKNYSHDTNNIFSTSGITVKISMTGDEEPSLIYSSLPVVAPTNPSAVPMPSYYPTYKGLTPEQRWMYHQFLKNPFDDSNDIGYVFIFYYGLERYLLTDKSYKAFIMILNLRSVYSNNSFLSYSETALAAYCMGTKDISLTNELLLSLNTKNVYMEDTIFFALKYSCKIPITANDIIIYHKSFSFTNNRYIKNNIDIFRMHLQKNIESKYLSQQINLDQYFNKEVLSSLAVIEIPIVSNISLKNRTIQIPNLLSYGKFISDMCELLLKTHEDTKAALATARKKNRL